MSINVLFSKTCLKSNEVSKSGNVKNVPHLFTGYLRDDYFNKIIEDLLSNHDNCQLNQELK